jgi:hypothetical protein
MVRITGSTERRKPNSLKPVNQDGTQVLSRNRMFILEDGVRRDESLQG